MFRKLSEIYKYPAYPFAVCSTCGEIFEHDLKFLSVFCDNDDTVLTNCKTREEAINLSTAIKLLSCDENYPGNRVPARIQ